MSTDEFGGIFNFSVSETSSKKGREESYKNNFIRETTLASGENVSCNDRPLPIIDATDMSDSQEMSDSQPSQLSPPPAQPPNVSRHAENEFSPSYIAQIEYEIAKPPSMTEKCDKLRKSLLAKTDATPAQLLLMWDHATAIGQIAPARGETLHNPPGPPNVDPRDKNIQIVDLTSASSAGLPHTTDASLSQDFDVYELPSQVVTPVPDAETETQPISVLPRQILAFPDEISDWTESELSQPSIHLTISGRGRKISTLNRNIVASTRAKKALVAKKAASVTRKTTRASSRLRSTADASTGVAPPDPMEVSTSTCTPPPPARKPNAVGMTANRTANNNELHTHTNPLNLTFVERAEAFFLAQEHNLKETPTFPIPSAELLTPLNPSSPYFAPSQACSSSTQVPATQYPNILPQTSPNQSLIQEMLAALQPALDAVALKFELGLKELKAGLLGEIVISRDHITAQDTKIASLQARLRAPPKIMENNVIPWDIPSRQNLPPPPGLRVHLKAPGNIPPLPPPPAATQPLHSVWATVSGKRKETIKVAPTPEQAAKIAKLSPVKSGPFTYPRTEREVVIEFENLLRLPTTLTSDSARNAVNKMLIDRKDVTVPPFVSARFSRNNNLVLTTPPAKNNIEYEAYLGLICEALTPLGGKVFPTLIRNGQSL
jgi:hypothetical protein